MKKIYLVDGGPDTNQRYSIYDSIEDAVNDCCTGYGVEIFEAELKPIGKYKQEYKIVKVKKK